MPNYFVFFHAGEETLYPAILTKSIKRTCADAYVIQCSDIKTPKITGVDEVKIVEVDRNALMTSRLNAFADLDIDSPAAYVDTDMVFLDEVRPELVLDGAQVAVCRRSFGNEDRININFRGMDLSEYQGKTFGEVCPYIACFTVTEDAGFWRQCADELNGLQNKFHFWYGDQEAIRNVVNKKLVRCRELPESIYGCLPERQGQQSAKAKILHFKGAQRKEFMRNLAISQGLLSFYY